MSPLLPSTRLGACHTARPRVGFRTGFIALLFVVGCDDDAITDPVDRVPLYGPARIELAVTVAGPTSNPVPIAVLVNGEARGSVAGSGGRLEFTVPQGRHLVTLGDLALRCRSSLAMPYLLTVKADDTRAVTLGVECSEARPQRVAFVAAHGTDVGDIFVTDLDEGGVENLTDTPAITEGHPSWSPDGERLAFSTVQGPGLAIMNVDGTGRRSLEPWTLAGRAMVRAPRWSPDGSRIVAAVGPPSDEFIAGLWIVPLAGGDPVRLTDGGPGVTDHPGGWLTEDRVVFWRYVRPASPTERARNEIRTVDVSTGVERLLREIPIGEWLTPPAPSPDGSSIAFTVWSWDWWESELWTMNADGSDPRMVRNTYWTTSDVQWTYDGRALVYLLDHQVHTVRLDGAGGRILSTLPGARDVALAR